MTLFNFDVERAGIDEREAPSVAVRLGCGWVDQRQEWVMVMRRVTSRASKSVTVSEGMSVGFSLLTLAFHTRPFGESCCIPLSILPGGATYHTRRGGNQR